MTRFTVRVELHGTTDYEPLHDAMASRGFTRTIKGKDGREFQLPPGEYNEISSRSGPEIRADVWNTIKAIGQKGAVLVTPSTGRWWIGLDEVEDSDDEIFLSLFLD